MSVVNNYVVGRMFRVSVGNLHFSQTISHSLVYGGWGGWLQIYPPSSTFLVNCTKASTTIFDQTHSNLILHSCVNISRVLNVKWNGKLKSTKILNRIITFHFFNISNFRLPRQDEQTERIRDQITNKKIGKTSPFIMLDTIKL